MIGSPSARAAEQLVGRVGVGEVDLVIGQRLLVGTPLHPRVVAAPTRRGDVPAVSAQAIGDRRRDARPPADPRDQRPSRAVLVLTVDVCASRLGGGGR